ncbi:MAG: hypothetical protein QF449_03300 [Alphaproteobacteria bacterium]|mgnify:CR=1 FL=1|jgi:hypothetical protein|nr:hypothetical protein [Alphaproteobacteria bacterium]|tara:strand:- start:3297 stop:3695 length:399 start_codon:yes stop_codon:yes gene_type:complete
MTDFDAIEARIERLGAAPAELLAVGEEILEHWLEARGEIPGREAREGFRLLALHRQAARGEPSFNACRETCRELVYRYNLIALDPEHPETARRIKLAAMAAKHLCLFVGGKMTEARIGEFCCASRDARGAAE